MVCDGLSETELVRSVADVSVDYFRDSILQCVNFAKQIPGFRQLCLDDQCNLLRGICLFCLILCHILILFLLIYCKVKSNIKYMYLKQIHNCK